MQVQSIQSGECQKIVSREEASVRADEVRRQGGRVVFTNGCFDILHVGHVRYLRAARRQGDWLIVGLNSDRSVQELKGPERPLVSEDERAEVLAALACVDAVCIFDELRPDDLIRAVRPDIHVKGGDYTEDQLPEAPLVRSLGGEVRIMPLIPGRPRLKQSPIIPATFCAPIIQPSTIAL